MKPTLYERLVVCFAACVDTPVELFTLRYWSPHLALKAMLWQIRRARKRSEVQP